MLIEHIRPAPKQWQYDRSNTIGASEIMNCARYLFALKNGFEPDPDHEETWGFGERGNVIEAWAVDRLIAAGVPIEKAGNEQETVLDGFLSGTPDGWVGDVLVEIKSKDPRIRTLPKPQHVTQAEINTELTGKASAVLLYIDASDLADMKEFEIPRNPDVIPMAKERARKIFRAKSMDDLPREGWMAGGDECGRCPFRRRCIRDVPDGVGVPQEAQDEIAKLVQRAAEAKKAENDAVARARAIKEEISAILRKHGARRAPGLARITVTERTTLDQRAMEAAGIDLTPYRRTGKPSETVTLEQ